MAVSYNVSAGALRDKVKVYRFQNTPDGRGGFSTTADYIGVFSMEANEFNGYPLTRLDVNFQAVQNQFISRWSVGLKVKNGDIFLWNNEYFSVSRAKSMGNRQAILWIGREVQKKDVQYLPPI